MVIINSDNSSYDQLARRPHTLETISRHTRSASSTRPDENRQVRTGAYVRKLRRPVRSTSQRLKGFITVTC